MKACIFYLENTNSIWQQICMQGKDLKDTYSLFVSDSTTIIFPVCCDTSSFRTFGSSRSAEGSWPPGWRHSLLPLCLVVLTLSLCSAVSDFAHPLLQGRCEDLRMAQSDVLSRDFSSLAFFPHLMKDIDSRSSSAELSTTSAKIFRKDQEIILRFFPQACRTSYEDGRSLV